MKKYFLLLFLVSISAFTIISCGGQKFEVVEIESLELYADPIVKFEIKYPSNWQISRDPGNRLVAFTSREGIQRFRNLSNLADETPAAKVDFMAIKVGPNDHVDSVIARKQFLPETYSDPIPVVIDGINAIKQTYQFQLGHSEFKGVIYYATKDSQVVSVISFEDIGGNFDKYEPYFNEILASVKLAYIPTQEADTLVEVVELPPPSATVTNHNAQGFSISYPDNFNIANPRVSGAEKSYNYIGQRRGDCNVQVDIIDPKGKDLSKIVGEEKAKYGNAEPRSTTIGGGKAYQINYSVRADIQSRVYFVIHNDKLYRVTMNWFKAEESDYLPAFEKMVSSIKFN